MAEKVKYKKVFVTKYALTQGILTYENAESNPDISDKMISVKQKDTNIGFINFHKPDWHLTMEEAKKRQRT